jgi:hypothetical protein
MSRDKDIPMQRSALVLLTIGLLAFLSPAVSAVSGAVVVHEWGTFTSLQNEAGQTIGGINTDDEPVPAFVHRITSSLLIQPTEAPPVYSKGAPSCHPDVTMRLETPVLYFHLPMTKPPLHGVTVTVRLRGGWLSESYPDGAVDAPQVTGSSAGFGRLGPGTVGSLVWKDLEVGVDGAGPATAAHVWTAPRAVQAQAVRTAAGETEKFLFYRGVAHIDAPLVAVQDAPAGQLVLSSRLSPALAAQAPLQASPAWLVDVKPGGAMAFRLIPRMTLGSGETVAVSLGFGPGDYNNANRAKLAAELRDALVAAGLFGDEAQALLSTWELSYFRSAGMRVFFLVPRTWTDFHLPLTVSVEAQITRVMVGRIELVTPGERQGLAQIGELSAEETSAEAQRMREAIFALSRSSDAKRVQDVMTGRLPLRATGVAVSRAYKMYLALGRFRNALVLDEAARHPTAGMAALISAYGLEGYQPTEPGPAAAGR